MTTEPRTDPTASWAQQQQATAYPPPPAPYGAPAAAGYPAAGFPPPPPGYAPPPGFQGGPAYAAGSVPGIGPVIAFTAVFGVFGAISASRRAAKARAAGASGRKYWVTFGATVVASWALWGTIAGAQAMAGSDPVTSGSTQQAAPAAVVPAVDVAAPAGTDVLDAAYLQASIVADGDFRTAEGEAAQVAAATCSAVQVNAQGAGTYRCVLDFASGSRQSSEITVDASGSWVTGD